MEVRPNEPKFCAICGLTKTTLSKGVPSDASKAVASAPNPGGGLLWPVPAAAAAPPPAAAAAAATYLLCTTVVAGVARACTAAHPARTARQTPHETDAFIFNRFNEWLKLTTLIIVAMSLIRFNLEVY